MRPCPKLLATGIATTLLMLTSATAHAEDDSIDLGVGVDFSSGDYGTGVDTDILSVPVSLAYNTGLLTLKLTVPYVNVDGSSNVIPAIGSLENNNPRGRGRGRGNTGGGTPPPTQDPTSGSASGLGDIVLAGTYSVYTDVQSGFGLDLTGKVKFGTADEDDGLGTGQNDYSVLLDAYRQIGDWTVFGGGGYTTFGDSAFIRLRDAWSANIGAGYRLAGGDSVGLIYDYRERISATGSSRSEATGYYNLRLSATTRLQSYAVAGFSDGSPDWGLGVSLKYRF